MDTYQPHPIHANAVVLPVFSAIALTLGIAPFVWHVRSRNVGAASLIFWISLLLLMNTVNPIIWPRDNLSDWWIGHGLCDIEIRLQIGASVGSPAAASCILRRLAKVLDTKKITVKSGASDKRRQNVMDLLICFGASAAVMVSYYAVHVNRYDIFAITGCSWPIDDSWVSIALVLIWPVVFCVFCVYYAVLVVIRLYRYRRDFSRLLSNSSTTKSRFLRLFLMSLCVIFMMLPVGIYAVVFTLQVGLHPYHWSWVHDNWDVVLRYPTKGAIPLWDRICWVVSGYVVVMFFGMGRDARGMYRTWLAAAGLGRLFPSLLQSETKSSQQGSMLSSMSNKAKQILRLKSKDSSRSGSVPTATMTATTTTTISSSPRKSSFRLSYLSFGKALSPTVSDLPIYEPHTSGTLSSLDCIEASVKVASKPTEHGKSHAKAHIVDIGSYCEQ